jgi:hypothetical protein
MEIISLPKNLGSNLSHNLSLDDLKLLEILHRNHFEYFRTFQDPTTGLILDRSTSTAPASIAATGFGLSAYIVAVHRGWVSSNEAYVFFSKVLFTLNHRLQDSTYEGWWSHFLEPQTGMPAVHPKFWDSEISTIDTALLLSGILSLRSVIYDFTPRGNSLLHLCNKILNAVKWGVMLDSNQTGLFTHGKYANGETIPHLYKGYSEALLLYLLSLGLAEEEEIPATIWSTFLKDSECYKQNPDSFIAMPGTPLFCYQYPHCWFDFRDIRDFVGDRVGFDYHENSRRLTLQQKEYAIRNPRNFTGYGELGWGFSASDGPGYVEQKFNATTDGVEGKNIFYGYHERGAPDGIDDGTICPPALLASLPFAVDEVWPAIKEMMTCDLPLFKRHGFVSAYNLTYKDSFKQEGWCSVEHVGIDQGAGVLMVENLRSELMWNIMQEDPAYKAALKKAGFKRSP